MNNSRAISPFHDLGFKLRFANESHKEILAGLIRDFFDFEPKRIEIVNPAAEETRAEAAEYLGMSEQDVLGA
jgi:hypothetical protein